MPAERVLPTFVREALAGSPLKVAGRGTRRQDYVHVADVADAVAGAIQAGADGLFNVARGETVSNLELAQRCIEVSASSSEVVLGEQPDSQDGLVWDVSITRAREAFGYQPRREFDDAIRELVDNLG